MQVLFEHIPSGVEVRDPPRVILTMIVKNEGKIIERCLRKALDSYMGLDAISITDTGSTDDTVEVIRKVILEYNIPGRVYLEPWKNFGHNRSLSFLRARQLADVLQFEWHSTYALFLDADMCLEVREGFKREELTESGYRLMQKYGSLEYFNLRLGRMDFFWRSLGVTHEYWDGGAGSTIFDNRSLWIDDKEDGGCKSDKFQRDARLLEEGLREEVEKKNEGLVVRYLFYLGQTYKCLGEWDKAISVLQDRIRAGGWAEEIYYAMFYIGQCYYEKAKDDEQFFFEGHKWMLRAWSFRPSRAEALIEISRVARNKSDNALAAMTSFMASKTPATSDVLFVQTDAYAPGWNWREELSICGFYTPLREEGFKALEQGLLRPGTPVHIRLQMQNNLEWYVKKISDMIPERGRCTLGANPEALVGWARGEHKGNDTTEFYRPCNPSLQVMPDGRIRCMLRSVNYTQERASNYVMKHADDKVRTQNYQVFVYPENLKVDEESLTPLAFDFAPNRESRILGAEDVRWVAKEYVQGKWFSDLVTLTSVLQTPRVCLSRVGAREFLETQELHLSPSTQCEKNWNALVSSEGDVFLVYSYTPLRIHRLTPEGLSETPEPTRPEERVFDLWRGSAGFVNITSEDDREDGVERWLGTIHEVAVNYNRPWGRFYAHRLVEIVRNAQGVFSVGRCSPEYILEHVGIEFNSGMCLSKDKRHVFFAWGLEDRQALITKYRLSDLMSLLK